MKIIFSGVVPGETESGFEVATDVAGKLGFTLFFGAFQEPVHRHFVAGVGFFEFGILVFDGAAGCGDGAQFFFEPVDFPGGLGVLGAVLELLEAYSVLV